MARGGGPWRGPLPSTRQNSRFPLHFPNSAAVPDNAGAGKGDVERGKGRSGGAFFGRQGRPQSRPPLCHRAETPPQGRQEQPAAKQARKNADVWFVFFSFSQEDRLVYFSFLSRRGCCPEKQRGVGSRPAAMVASSLHSISLHSIQLVCILFN